MGELVELTGLDDEISRSLRGPTPSPSEDVTITDQPCSRSDGGHGRARCPYPKTSLIALGGCDNQRSSHVAAAMKDTAGPGVPTVFILFLGFARSANEYAYNLSRLCTSLRRAPIPDGGKSQSVQGVDGF